MLLIRQLLKCYNENENFNKKIPNSNVYEVFNRKERKEREFFCSQRREVAKFFSQSCHPEERRIAQDTP